MTDHFAALDQPRRPWIDPSALKDHFHSLTATLHPDIPLTGDATRFAMLNGAYQVLREPASRLRHFLELERSGPSGDRPAVPASIASRFMTIAALRQAFETFMGEQHKASHALQRALLAPQRIDLEKQIAVVLNDLESVAQQAMDDLRAADAGWATDRVAALPRLAELQAQFAYLSKWIAQLQEMRFALEAVR
ncbi:MAG: hscB [Chthoniobacter sp.]|nr:hscB [Chthoniobacter sp.]